MGRRALYIALLLVVGLFLYLGYNSYDAKRAGASGDVYSATGKLKMEPMTTPAPAAPEATQSGTQLAQAGTPWDDTTSPNPPNGMKFSGSGRYQLYRQGNITWRLDTTTGRTCVVFATDEEWKKPKVYRNGCGKQ